MMIDCVCIFHFVFILFSYCFHFAYTERGDGAVGMYIQYVYRAYFDLRRVQNAYIVVLCFI